MFTNYKDLKTTVTGVMGAVIAILPTLGVVMPPFWTEMCIASTIIVMAILMHMDKKNVALSVTAIVLIVAAKFGLTLEQQVLSMLDAAILALLGLFMKDKEVKNDAASKIG